jgi:predicted enzyme involved in methoxymalonyl-ACP biosynthesis
MDFAPMDEDNIERIAQLTDRTNQVRKGEFFSTFL